jgi:DDE superfamily endonuclease
VLLSSLPALLSRWIARLVGLLDRRTAPRVALLLCGLLLARGRRTVTSWMRPAGIAGEFRRAYGAVAACGRRADDLARALLWDAVAPVQPGCGRLTFAIDDTPTRRYGPQVEGAGVHHNPSQGPAGAPFVYGHVWVTLAWLARHPVWGSVALPLLARLYVRHQDLPKVPPDRRPPFQTKLELAGELVRWLTQWVRPAGRNVWLAADGFYAKRPFLKEAAACGVTVVSRLRKDSALRTLPPTHRPAGKRGPMPRYGAGRIDLAKRAGQSRGWSRLECEQYGRRVTKVYKTFLATWPPAGGTIRVVLVREDDGWVAFFCTDPSASVLDILEAAAARGAIEQAFKDAKEVWGAGQQQLRNLHANVGAFHLNLWMQTMVETQAWARPEGELIRRDDAPWESKPRRPSHADKRRAVQREIVANEIQAAVSQAVQAGDFRGLAKRLVKLLG